MDRQEAGSRRCRRRSGCRRNDCGPGVRAGPKALEGRIPRAQKQMKCLVCKNTQMKQGTTMLPIERGRALLLITDIPARICSNCGEPYIDEAVAQEVEDLANQELSGSVSYQNARGKR